MNENLPGFVRCVHPKREGAEWFNAKDANNPAWQRSTGWVPQPEAQSFKAGKPKNVDKPVEPLKTDEEKETNSGLGLEKSMSDLQDANSKESLKSQEEKPKAKRGRKPKL